MTLPPLEVSRWLEHGWLEDAHLCILVLYYNGARFGKVARLRLRTFSNVAVLDLTTTDNELKDLREAFQTAPMDTWCHTTAEPVFGKVA